MLVFSSVRLQFMNIRTGIIIVLTGFLCMNTNGCAQEGNSEGDEQEKGHAFTNALINESSPYLLQHAHNPVNWYPWGEKALQKAKSEGKLMIISIGYSACHWCHVMERESYEDTTVARIMNEHYISIKIDREERPDIDQVYIEAAQMLIGSAGWPLNVITLPDATPVFAGTYFPRDRWINIIKQVQEVYEQDPERLTTQAQKIMTNLKQYNAAGEYGEQNVSKTDIALAVDKWKGKMDKKHGGLQSTIKFPLPGSLHQLLNYGYLKKDKKALELAELTLDRMALGGIFDHVGGGFHRYTVEPTWQIPHFEKMLYDNGQLMSLYAAGYQVFGKEIYLNVLDKTLRFITTEMMNTEGGFYSSYDADSEGEEGKYYVWSSGEIESLLKDATPIFKDYYLITQKGNWEKGYNILHAKDTPEAYFSKSETNISLDENLEILRKARNNRVKPGLDEKVLTAWNALMMQGFIDAYRATGNDGYLETALKNADFLINRQLDDDGRLNRNYKDGKSSINAFFDDYAFTIRAFISLYQVTFDIIWLERAVKLSDYSIAHFYDADRKLFRYKSDLDEALIVSKFPVNDNVIPSGNSVMANNLFVLGNLFYEEKPGYLEMVNGMLDVVAERFKESPYYHYGWMPVFYNNVNGFYEIAIVGDEFDLAMKEMQRHYIPDAIYLGGQDDQGLSLLNDKLVAGMTYIYVCQNKFCKLPVDDPEKAIALIER